MLLGLLGCVFVLAGVRAMSMPEPVVCSCFGSSHRSVLGRNQLIAFPFWVISGVLLSRGSGLSDAESALRMVCLAASISLFWGALGLYSAFSRTRTRLLQQPDHPGDAQVDASPDPAEFQVVR